MKEATAAEIEKQFNFNVDRMVALTLEHNNEATSAFRRAEIVKKLKELEAYQNGWSRMYLRRTGQGLFALYPSLVTKTEAEAQARVDARQAKNDRKAEIKTLIAAVRNDLSRLQEKCLYLYEHSQNNQIAAGLVNTVGGNGMFQPAVIFTNAKVDVEAALTKAASHTDRAQFEQAMTQVSVAAGKIVSAYDAVNQWEAEHVVGGNRTILAIQVSAAVATVVAGGGAAAPQGATLGMRFLWRVAPPTVETLAHETTLLLSRILGGGESIGTHDLTAASLNVAISGGAAALGGFAESVSQQLLGPIVKRVSLGRWELTDVQTKEVSDILRRYITTNADYIAKRLADKDKNEALNIWHMLLTPLVTEWANKAGKKLAVEKTPVSPE